jgi:hypothetical protein
MQQPAYIAYAVEPYSHRRIFLQQPIALKGKASQTLKSLRLSTILKTFFFAYEWRISYIH